MSYFKDDYIPTCGDCRNADLYIPSWSAPYIIPKCVIHHRTVKYDDVACKHFKMVGRRSRWTKKKKYSIISKPPGTISIAKTKKKSAKSSDTK